MTALKETSALLLFCIFLNKSYGSLIFCETLYCIWGKCYDETTSAPPAKAGISRTGMSKAYDSRRKELKLRMKKWMKICLMAAASAMLLAGCGTKDNTAETTAVETMQRQKIQKKLRQKKQKRQPGLQQVKQQKLQRQPRKTVNWIWQQLQESTM